MHCPTLKDLPEPPPSKRGWPWTEESTPLQHSMTDRQEWPPITIVTPSYNQGRFIEETIRSVLLQGYSNIEYLVLDGGSTDESIRIIEKYSSRLTYWASDPDGGQSAAINRGLRMGTGLFATWLNSDDLLCGKRFRDQNATKAVWINRRSSFRALALSVGALDIENNYTMDCELWGESLNAGAEFHYTDVRFEYYFQADLRLPCAA